MQEYEPFYGDFGPLNMGHTFMFCTRTASLLQVPSWHHCCSIHRPDAGAHVSKCRVAEKLHLLLLQSRASQGKMLYLYTAPHAWKRANAAALVGVHCTNGTSART
jgi:cell division cycle 14